MYFDHGHVDQGHMKVIGYRVQHQVVSNKDLGYIFNRYESPDWWITSIYCLLIIIFEIFIDTSALHKVFQDKKKRCLVNAAIYVDPTEEEILWLGTQHNNKQRLLRQISAQDYVSIKINVYFYSFFPLIFRYCNVRYLSNYW